MPSSFFPYYKNLHLELSTILTWKLKTSIVDYLGSSFTCPFAFADVNLVMVKLKGFLTLQKKWKIQLLSI